MPKMKIRVISLERRLKEANFFEGDNHPLIAEIQRQLVSHALYHGPCHGYFDAETRDAVAMFQEREDIQVTGQIDPITFCRLQQSQNYQVSPLAKKQQSSRVLARANILLIKSQRRLTLFDGNVPVRQYPVAIGKVSTPTPVGNFAIATKIMNPGGLLGTRWMGLNYDAYGIHGTNITWIKEHDKNSVAYFPSFACTLLRYIQCHTTAGKITSTKVSR